jgi:GlpG protein
MTICVACVVATSLTGFMELPNRFTRELALIPITPQKGGRVTFLLADDDPVRLIREGQVWRPFTPALLHGGILHLLLDLQVFYVFGTAVEHVRGTLRLIGLTLLSAAAGNLIQYWWGGPVFCGLSGVGYALYGYVWMKTLFQPETRFVIPRSMHIMFWAWTLVCFSGLLPIANGAHSGGLVIGILYGLITFL